MIPLSFSLSQDYTSVNTVNPHGSWFSYLVQYFEYRELSWCYRVLNGLAPEPDVTNLD